MPTPVVASQSHGLKEPWPQTEATVTPLGHLTPRSCEPSREGLERAPLHCVLRAPSGLRVLPACRSHRAPGAASARAQCALAPKTRPLAATPPRDEAPRSAPAFPSDLSSGEEEARESDGWVGGAREKKVVAGGVSGERLGRKVKDLGFDKPFIFSTNY